VENEEIDPTGKLEVRELIRLAEQGINTLKSVYPEVDLIYREKSENNDLPKLKIKITDIKNGSLKNQNPFGISRNY
jgi:hypothetical protein